MMKMLDIIQRQPIPKPWTEGEKIPWNEPAFSERMLKEHLSQDHDAASRRAETIDRHVHWIHEEILQGKPTRILDLGCGPGFYLQRLAQLGHQCVGIDFSPASIEYAKEQAVATGLDCTYIQGDIRNTEYGEGFGLIMSIFGEFNVFHPDDAKNILEKANRALTDNGRFLFEPHTFKFVEELGYQSATWHTNERGLFSQEPHLYLQEYFWDKQENVTMQRYIIVDAASSEVSFHSSSMQAYTNEGYQSLLTGCGFKKIEFFPALAGKPGDPEEHLIGILAQKSS